MVELRLTAKAKLAVRRVGLRFPKVSQVPLRFIAEAPGELTVEDWEVSWETAETTTPAPPAIGSAPRRRRAARPETAAVLALARPGRRP